MNNAYNDTVAAKLQSVLSQWDDFADVGELVTLPPASQLNLSAVEEGIAHCTTRSSTTEETEGRKSKNLPIGSSSSVAVVMWELIGRPVLESRNTPAWSTNGAGRSFAARWSWISILWASSKNPWMVSKNLRVCRCLEEAQLEAVTVSE